MGVTPFADVLDLLARLHGPCEQATLASEAAEIIRSLQAEVERLRAIIRAEHLWTARQRGRCDCKCHCDVCEPEAAAAAKAGGGE